MQQQIVQYITEVNKLYKAGNATEHSYRPALKILLEALMPRYTATNEPKRIACGAPDYIITDRNLAVGYVEAKDIPVNLNDKSLKEQFERYRNSLDNLIITNYIIFRWYAKGELVEEIAIGKESDNKIIPLTDNFGKFTEIIKQFAVYHTEGIKTSAELSKQMAAKARLLAEIIETSLNKDIENKEETELNNQYEGFRSILIDTISTKDFADLYAQTIAYGMFAARMNYNETGDFTREKAAKSIPQTNPFLRKMFGFIAGIDLDSRISWVVDTLADLFNYVDIKKIHAEIGRYADNDPIIHFYETFLTDYDKKLKKQRGVWYTPQPVVRFIVQAVDEILKTDFGISAGLANSEKVMVGNNEYHKVQILDPATGTGTFLAEVVEQIYKHFENQQGMWNDYVNKHLIPRLNGFEILMASYAMAHLKLEMLLQETHAEITNNQRLKIYLTDSLEPAPTMGEKKLAFAKWLTDEANEAAAIKRDTPVMVILGNPPYNSKSQNNGKSIMDLMQEYKKDLNERNIQPLNDDYIKFIRLGQYFINKNNEGILAYISNNSFIDGLIHRQMRKSLMETFDKIYILDLHGNAKKKETAPDGSKDENVFDIEQGVSINIFVKAGKKNENKLAEIYHYNLYGKRSEKYNFLLNNDLHSLKWNELKPVAPNYFIVPKDFSLKEEYEKGFSVTDLFNVSGSGVKFRKDNLLIKNNFNQQEVKAMLYDLNTLDNNSICVKYNFSETPDWKLSDKKIFFKQNDFESIRPVQYRPFDIRYTYYPLDSIEKIIVRGDSRKNLMQHFIKGENIGLVVGRQGQVVGSMEWNLIFTVNKISDLNLYYRGGGTVFPLYLYQETFGQIEKFSNLNKAIVAQFPSFGGVPAGRGGGDAGKQPPPAPSKGGELCPEISPVSSKGGELSAPVSSKGMECGRNTQNYMQLPYNPKLKERARELRKAGNLSEVLFWNRVKNKQFKNYDFDRQKIVGNYIVDFFCTNCNVVIEIDGSSHDDKQEYDAARDAFLQSVGLTVIHIPDIDVKKQLNSVMEMLHNHEALQLPTAPLQPPTALLQPPTAQLLTTPSCGHPSKGGELWPEHIFDYIYAVLHSPSYREKYREFLKIDFPRIPYPKSAEKFKTLAVFGEKLRHLHLMETFHNPSKGEESPLSNWRVAGGEVANFPVQGSNEIENSFTERSNDYNDNKVFINGVQYFDNVPEIAWNFYIGGYQPAQKWLKDRKGRKLGFDDVCHYQKIIFVLTETDRIMKEIDLAL